MLRNMLLFSLRKWPIALLIFLLTSLISKSAWATPPPQFSQGMLIEYEGTQATICLHGTNNCIINWGDGATDTITTSGIFTHNYSSNISHIVEITGSATDFGRQDTDGLYLFGTLKRLIQWGNLGLINLEGAFLNATNLTSVPDSIPSTVTKCKYMFYGTQNFNDSNIVSWNTSHVTDMSGMFAYSTSFNQPIGNWDVSNVTNIGSMFENSIFNQPLNNWNVSNVTQMTGLFSMNLNFNQPLDSWNVSNVPWYNMSQMFFFAMSFNQDLSSWCVGVNSMWDPMFNLLAPAANNPLWQPNWGTSCSPSSCGLPTYITASPTANNVTFNWNKRLTANATQIQIRIKGTTSWGGTSVSGQSYVFNSLQPNTTYEYRFRSLCTGQSGVFTRIGEFTTPVYVAPLPYCNAPTNINATVTGANSVTLTWTASDSAQQYFVQYKPSTSSWANSFGSTAYSTTKTFTNLVPNTTYDYRIRTTCVTGQTMNPGSTFSSINNFTTLPGDLSALFNVNESAWSIYPNPTHDLVQLEFTSSVEAPMTIMVFDMTGRLVQSIVTQSLKGNNQIDISLGTLSNGMYIIKSRQGDAVTTLGKVTKN